MPAFGDIEAAVWLTGAVAACGVGVATLAAPARPDDPEVAALLLARIDADADGEVSPAEYARASDEVVAFEVADVDRSGALEARECELLLVYVSPLALQKNFLPMVR
ncbi:MAG: hypothetical protein ACOZNI_33475 [Myxococcota bacterium]